MKLVGELKKEVEKIETKEGKKEAIKKAGMELSDEELDQVAGGWPRDGLDFIGIPISQS